MVIYLLVIVVMMWMLNVVRKNFVVVAVRATDVNGENFEVRYFIMEVDVDLFLNWGY